MTGIKFNIKNTVHGFCLVFLACMAATGCRKESAFQKKAKPELIISGDDPRLESDMIHFSKDTVYVLATDLTINSGQVFQLEAGTLVKVNNKLSITINEGGRIEAGGTKDAPIIFTSSAAKGGAGLGTGTVGGERWWYGIRIYGNFLTNPVLGSGFLKYVRVEFAGGNENFLGLPSLLLQDQTKATIIDNVQVSYSFQTPSFGFYGGDCNASNLVSYASGLTDFKLDNGYKGMLQNVLAYRHPYFPVSGSSGTGGEDFGGLVIDGSETFPIISNVTVIGPDLQKGTTEEYSDTVAPGRGRRVGSLVVKGGARFHISNSLFFGFPNAGFYLGDKISAQAIQHYISGFTNSIVHSNDSSRAFFLRTGVYIPYESYNFRIFMLDINPQFNVRLLTNTNELMLSDPFNYDVDPDPMPKTGSPLLSGASFDGPFSDPFFKKVNNRGALGSDNWLQGWTNFIPLQTNYNN